MNQTSGTKIIKTRVREIDNGVFTVWVTNDHVWQRVRATNGLLGETKARKFALAWLGATMPYEELEQTGELIVEYGLDDPVCAHCGVYLPQHLIRDCPGQQLDGSRVRGTPHVKPP